MLVYLFDVLESLSDESQPMQAIELMTIKLKPIK
jgi:hypothetical protein